MRERVQCLIIKDKKILFVKDKLAAHFYPPGGGVDDHENHEEAISRELMEELEIKCVKRSFFSSYNETNVVRNHPQVEHNYFVEFEGEPKPASEIEEIKWVNWNDIVSNKFPLPPNLYEELLIKLKEKDFL